MITLRAPRRSASSASLAAVTSSCSRVVSIHFVLRCALAGPTSMRMHKHATALARHARSHGSRYGSPSPLKMTTKEASTQRGPFMTLMVASRFIVKSHPRRVVPRQTAIRTLKVTAARIAHDGQRILGCVQRAPTGSAIHGSRLRGRERGLEERLIMRASPASQAVCTSVSQRA